MVSKPSFRKTTTTMSIVSATRIFVPTLDQISLPNYTFPFKLAENNYIIWKSQIFLATIGGNFEGFINDQI